MHAQPIVDTPDLAVRMKLPVPFSRPRQLDLWRSSWRGRGDLAPYIGK
jgi:hypothetical protein